MVELEFWYEFASTYSYLAAVQIEEKAERAGVEPSGARFWTDAALLGASGTPAVLYGPRGDGAHAEVEWVDLDSVETVRDVIVDVARTFCG